MSTIITAIDRHSPAERAGVQVGEQLLSINGHPIVDVLDYRFYGYDPLSHLELKTEATCGTSPAARPKARTWG